MNTKYTNIRVLVGRSIESVENGQCDDVRNCDTVREAKSFVRYAFTVDYQKSGEFSERMNYARIVADEDDREVIVYDSFRYGYVPAQPVS